MAEIPETNARNHPDDHLARTQDDTLQKEVLYSGLAHCETIASHPYTNTILRHRSLSETPRPNETAFDRLTGQDEVLVNLSTSKALARSKLAAAKQDWNGTRKTYEKALGSYQNAVDPFRKPTHKHVKALRKSLNRHQTALELQAGKIRELQEQLASAEASFAQNKAVFIAIIRETKLRPDHFPSTDAGPNPAAVSIDLPSTDAEPNPAAANTEVAHQAAESAPPDTHDLLEDYHASAANVGILGERLADYNYEYWSAVASREIRQDQDEALTQTEEEFEGSWLPDRLRLTRELDEAIKNADHLKEACEKKGLDTDTVKQRTPEADGAADGQSEHERPNNDYEAAMSHIPSTALDNAEVVRAESSDNDDTAPSNHRKLDHVELWVEETRVPDVETA